LVSWGAHERPAGAAMLNESSGSYYASREMLRLSQGYEVVGEGVVSTLVFEGRDVVDM